MRKATLAKHIYFLRFLITIPSYIENKSASGVNYSTC